MLDKNPESVFYNLQEILNKFSKKNPNIIVCSQPFTKLQFLNELIDSINFPIIYLDFDLLFTGYVISKMIPKKDKVEIYQLEKDNLEKIISQVVNRISNERCLVIVDSLNGFYNLFSEIESGIFVNSLIMLLTSFAREKKSIIVVSAMARNKEKKDWILSPGGRQIIISKTTGIYYLKNDEKSMMIKSLNQ